LVSYFCEKEVRDYNICEALILTVTGRYSPANAAHLDPAYDPTGVALENKIAGYHGGDGSSKNSHNDHGQSQFIESGIATTALAILDDKTVNTRFSRLNKEIADWILTHFKNSRPAHSPPRELTSVLIKTQPNYAYLMQENRTRYLVLRAITADILCEAMRDGQLFSNNEYTKMKDNVSRSGRPD
jgi:hypothetical protein